MICECGFAGAAAVIPNCVAAFQTVSDLEFVCVCVCVCGSCRAQLGKKKFNFELGWTSMASQNQLPRSND
ncbi:hypothetical protein BpHYR1_015972 [Brachionus plicatilis]|uniref:Uncharacterized protein n=1 Tax=Brachionus plicatilis TaxID=10195 RepID=A0A3M7T5G7_BRAPC|nr:hypothetical protein BpHYR1_015972 [Brachionus plicatilis]